MLSSLFMLRINLDHSKSLLRTRALHPEPYSCSLKYFLVLFDLIFDISSLVLSLYNKINLRNNNWLLNYDCSCSRTLSWHLHSSFFYYFPIERFCLSLLSILIEPHCDCVPPAHCSCPITPLVTSDTCLPPPPPLHVSCLCRGRSWLWLPRSLGPRSVWPRLCTGPDPQPGHCYNLSSAQSGPEWATRQLIC